jgi:hypothetical protein
VDLGKAAFNLLFISPTSGDNFTDDARYSNSITAQQFTAPPPDQQTLVSLGLSARPQPITQTRLRDKQ